ncbi:predicted protein [Nematostella vectensis]|uniref:ADP-dependent glucokinase n=1 Tax=Nematostella vectensis TaxID=45351 RepID=A7SLP2_NEMVE|nr:predicted protein [Nematostella vectensis]|eukprot:XP_001627484.1 predicted protein [Nematostella vectensis]
MLALEKRSRARLQQGPRPRIAIGFEATVDLSLNALELLKAIGIAPPARMYPHDAIENETALAETFAYFYAHSVASSRYVANKELFRKLSNLARKLESTRAIIGGTAVAFAIRFAKEQCDTVVAGRMTKATVEDLLPGNITIIGSQVPEDDIHLLLEFPGDEPWGEFTSQRANRMVLHSDEHNPYFTALEDLKTNTEQVKPNVVVIGGLHMMDNFPYKGNQRIERFTELSNYLGSLEKETKIHFEMGVFHEFELFSNLLEYVFPYSDSIGMNEQDLPNLLSMLKFNNITKVSTQKPRVAVVLDQMRQVYTLLRSKELHPNQRHVTRIHLHTLAFQAMLTTKGTWENAKSATAKASLTATRHVCGSRYIETHKSKVLMDDSFSLSVTQNSNRVPFNAENPVSCWEEKDYEFCVAPVLVCTEIKQTAGGGDNISAGGLSVQS